MVNFIRVPIEIWRMTDLQPGQRMLFALICGFTTSGKGCMMTNSALGEVLGCSARTISRYMTTLEQRNLIQITERGGHRVSMGVDTAMTWGGGHSHDVGGRQDHVYHIRKNKKEDIKHHNDETMNERPNTTQVAQYMQRIDRVQECKLSAGDVTRMAKDAVEHYGAAQWRTRNGDNITAWRPLMRAWVARSLKDYRPRQQRPQMTTDEIRRDIKWHTRRLIGYKEKGHADLAQREQAAINHLTQQLNAQ